MAGWALSSRKLWLVRTSGAGAFRELYFGCRPGRFAEALRSLGEGLGEVQERFWSAMREPAKKS
jgi:hypothetical protein